MADRDADDSGNQTAVEAFTHALIDSGRTHGKIVLEGF
jgi:hypothetical protein